MAVQKNKEKPIADAKVGVDSLLNVTQRCLKAYGQEVVEQRAVPDYRDGLKPVHRFILWSCYQLGLKYGTPFKKAARTVGDVIGKYHPHGDQSTYDAMVGLTGTKSDDGKVWVTKNINVPLIEGYGNWGDNVDNAAAMRYTEARLSEFATKYMLDPTYLAVTDFVPNFSGDEKVPLVLPARLPVLLLNGSVSIAFGVSAECPAFEPKGVIELVKRCLSGEEITPKTCAQLLTFQSVYGGECVSEKKDILAFHKHGRGTLLFLPTMQEDAKKRTVTLVSSCPGLSSKNNWASLMEKLSTLREVRSVSDSSDKHGFKVEVVSERNVEFDAFVGLVEDVALKKYSYDIGLTRRGLDSVEFARANVVKIVNDWCKWRVELEVKAIKYLIGVEDAKLKRLRLMLLAVDNLKIVMDSLRKDDSAAYLSKMLKITLEEANVILDLKVRQLKSLEGAKLKSQIRETESEIANLQKSLKQPTKRVLADLDSIRL